MILGPSHAYYRAIHQIPRVKTPLCVADSLLLCDLFKIRQRNINETLKHI